jgi:16S rRNA (uracil1498-N3)-methyltransferase
VELGVHSVQPLFSDFSFIKTAKEYGDGKRERMERIVRSATEQTCRGDLMQVLSPIQLKDWIHATFSILPPVTNQQTRPACLFAYEGGIGETRSLRGHLQALSEMSPLHVWTLVGSEGGFSDAEVKLLSEQGIPPMSLGPQILKAETACLATVSILKYELSLV